MRTSNQLLRQLRLKSVSTADDQFLERLRRGEAAAYERLVAEHSGDIYALLFRLTNDSEEARDLTQETFLRAFQSIDRFRGDASLKTWIYRIAINQARNRWRWWRRTKTGRHGFARRDGRSKRDSHWLRLCRVTNALNPEQETLARERERPIARCPARTERARFVKQWCCETWKDSAMKRSLTCFRSSIGTVKSRIARGQIGVAATARRIFVMEMVGLPRRHQNSVPIWVEVTNASRVGQISQTGAI